MLLACCLLARGPDRIGRSLYQLQNSNLISLRPAGIEKNNHFDTCCSARLPAVSSLPATTCAPAACSCLPAASRARLLLRARGAGHRCRAPVEPATTARAPACSSLMLARAASSSLACARAASALGFRPSYNSSIGLRWNGSNQDKEWGQWGLSFTLFFEIPKHFISNRSTNKG
jgi:hypothetical protein